MEIHPADQQKHPHTFLSRLATDLTGLAGKLHCKLPLKMKCSLVEHALSGLQLVRLMQN